MLTTSVTLLQRVRVRGDQAAWERFVSLYTPLLYCWAQRAGMADQDATDLVQEVFIILMNELPQFEYDTARRNFRGWLKTITIRKCREHQRRRNPTPILDNRDDVDAISPIEVELEKFWESEYQQYLVKKALAIMRTEFEERTWTACWEHVVSGKTAAEIGAALGMSEAAVNVAKSRVLRRLRQELHGLLD